MSLGVGARLGHYAVIVRISGTGPPQTTPPKAISRSQQSVGAKTDDTQVQHVTRRVGGRLSRWWPVQPAWIHRNLGRLATSRNLMPCSRSTTTGGVGVPTMSVAR